jgi:transposase IS116/IS110/IS902 family protein
MPTVRLTGGPVNDARLAPSARHRATACAVPFAIGAGEMRLHCLRRDQQRLRDSSFEFPAAASSATRRSLEVSEPTPVTITRRGRATRHTNCHVPRHGIGEIERFPAPEKLAGYTGLRRRLNQSGDKDRRGPLTTHGPASLHRAMLEATMDAPAPRLEQALPANKRRLGKQHGAKVAEVDIARRLTRRSGRCLLATRSSLPEGAAVRLAARPPSLDLRPRAKHPISPDPPPRWPERHKRRSRSPTHARFQTQTHRPSVDSRPLFHRDEKEALAAT